MAFLTHDIVLDESAFETASTNMTALSQRTQDLIDRVDRLYNDMANALQTPAGEALDLEAESVLVKPIEDLKLIIDHIAATLNTIKGSGYYKDIFIKYNELNNNIKIN